MQTQQLLDTVATPATTTPLTDTAAFIDFLRSESICSSDDALTRLVLAACAAGSQANASIAGHQAAVRRLFPGTPQNAVTAFCVSEARGPHPRYIDTRLEVEDGQAFITGSKMWGTMAPAATLLYVAASTGVVDGQNRLTMVAVDTPHPSITQIPLPPERQAGTVPICDLRFDHSPVRSDGRFDGDAYTRFIKPFRLIEDVFSTLATQIALFRLGAAAALSPEQREDLLGLIVQGHAVAASNMLGAADILLLTSYLRASQSHWNGIAQNWSQAAPAVQNHWRPDREILTVAARARAQRRRTAWQQLGVNLPVTD